MGHDKKSSHEIEVFQEFAVASGLDIDPKSITSCEPPEPDILCEIGGTPYYFELGRLLDKHSPQLRIEMVRSAPAPVPINPLLFGMPERDMLISKIEKSYETHGRPIDLILYYDNGDDNWLTVGAPPPSEFQQFAVDIVQPEIESRYVVFARIWIFERFRRSILWKFP